MWYIQLQLCFTESNKSSETHETRVGLPSDIYLNRLCSKVFKENGK
jgi:hypothetical protein